MSSQAVMPAGHPNEDVLESYALRRASGTVRAVIEQHLTECSDCRRQVILLRMFTTGTELTLRALKERPLRWVHQAPGGPVLLEVRGSPNGGWEATAPGGSPVRFSTLPEANGYLMRSFLDAYPSHECKKGCGPVGAA